MFVTKRVQVGARIVAAFMFVFATLLVSPYASAESTNNAPNTLKVSPVRTDITVKPGESKTVKMTISNLTDQPIRIKPIENDFVAGDETGAPALILDEDQYAPTHSLKRFMKPLADVTIQPNDAAAVELKITVPSDAKPGGYFGAVRFAPTSPEDGGQVNLSTSVASLVLLTVPGPATEKLNLTDFEIRQSGKANTIFSNPNDLNAYVRFENKGNIQIGPIGKISVLKGKDVVYEADFNQEDPRDVVLPDSARRWDIPLKKIDNFGHYTVKATFTYGTTNQTFDVEKSFWVIPTSVIIATVVGILLLIGLIVGIIYFLRGYKRRIIRRHGGGNSGMRL